MQSQRFEFSTNGTDYVFWAWKGDYLNLGAGAELAIYKRLNVAGIDTPQWIVDRNLAMPMTLQLKDNKGNVIFTYKPSEKQWWITGFNPYYQNVKAENLTAIYTIDFSGNKDMYDSFISSEDYIKNKDKWSVSKDNEYILTYTF